MGPFDRFNDRAKRVLALSQDEAIRFNHNYIGVEHLLLGLIREGEGVAARVLDSMDVDLSKVRTAVEFTIGRGDPKWTPTDITLSPRVKRVIDLALDEARKLGHSHVGTEHLLLGLLRDGVDAESAASKMLTSLGVNLEKARHQVVETLGQPGARSGPPPELAWAYDAQGKKRDWYCEDVLSGKTLVSVICEDERVLAFHHPHPEFQIHAVVIPKRHIGSLVAPEALDRDLLASMVWAVQEAASRLGLSGRGFQLRANAGTPDVTPHMHWHVIGPGTPPPQMSMRRPVLRAAEVIPTETGKRTGPFDRFDDSAKRVLALAQQEAIRLNHNYIGTEHLLAGLVREGASVGARALQDLGVALDKVRTSLEFIIGRGDETVAPSDITLSPRSKKVIELAIDEARRLGHTQVGSGHLLLGLVREGEGIASGILESLGVALETVRKKVIELMAQGHP